MSWSRQNRRTKAINEQKLSTVLSKKYRKQKTELFRVLVKYAKDLRGWIRNVYYALSICRRENVFWRLKCFTKYSKVRKMLAYNRKLKFFSATKQLMSAMNEIEYKVTVVNESMTRKEFYKLWLESIQYQRKKQDRILCILRRTHKRNLEGPFFKWLSKFLY